VAVGGAFLASGISAAVRYRSRKPNRELAIPAVDDRSRKSQDENQEPARTPQPEQEPARTHQQAVRLQQRREAQQQPPSPGGMGS